MVTAATQSRSARRYFSGTLQNRGSIAIGCLLGAEVIHTAVLPAHWREWRAAGLFFLVVSVAEGLTAAALLVARTRRTAAAGVALSFATIGVWVLSRTVGVPFGPFAWSRESLGVADAIATFFEAATVAALLPLARGRPDEFDRTDWPASMPRSGALAALLCLTMGAVLFVAGQGAGHGH